MEDSLNAQRTPAIDITHNTPEGEKKEGEVLKQTQRSAGERFIMCV